MNCAFVPISIWIIGLLGMFAAFQPEQGYLFGYQPHQKYHDRGGYEEERELGIAPAQKKYLY